MSTTFEKARSILNEVRPDEVDEVKVTELPEGGMHIEVTFHRASSVQSPGQGKWANIAQRLSREAPLTGMSEQFLDNTRRFRENFVMKPLPPDAE
jgi:hypothetical protein